MRYWCLKFAKWHLRPPLCGHLYSSDALTWNLASFLITNGNLLIWQKRNEAKCPLQIFRKVCRVDFADKDKSEVGAQLFV